MLWIRLIWTWAMSLCLFSLTSFVIFGVWAWNHPAFPAEKKCTITMAQFATLVKESNAFEEGHEMPPAKVPVFLRQFNKSPPPSGPADAITVWQHKELPLLRVVFSKGKCFTNLFDMPIPSFIKMLQGIEV